MAAVLHPAAPVGRLSWSAGLLGFALGGFFDGILLHQILQWHHLLSALERSRGLDLRAQILADGAFHALMYVLAAIGLLLHLRDQRRGVAAQGVQFLAAFLIGFGLWHGSDAVLAHGLLGLHRVRMDVAQPLAWDLGWVAVFGLLPLAAGWGLHRRNPSGAPGRPGAGRMTAGRADRASGSTHLHLPWLLIAVTVSAGGQALSMPFTRPGAPAAVAVVLRPGASAAAMLQAAARSDARVVWVDAQQQVWVLQPAEGDLRQLYRHGALYVGGTLGAAGCSAWVAGARS